MLRNPAQADAAWAALVNACAGYARHRSGADRTGLQGVLQGAGIELRAAQSYRSDIERLRAHTSGALTLQSRLADIRVGAITVKINRPAAAALATAAGASSVLVVGEPGAGKSGALYDAATSLAAAGHDVVFLGADQFAAESMTAIRNELDLEHGLPDVLRNWPGIPQGFLFIDALDAARSDGAARRSGISLAKCSGPVDGGGS